MPVLEKSADIRPPIDTSKPPPYFSRDFGGDNEIDRPIIWNDRGGDLKNYVNLEDFALTFYLSGFGAAGLGLLKDGYAGIFDGCSYDQFCRCLYVTLYAGDKANYWADLGHVGSDNTKTIFVHFPTAKPLMVKTLIGFSKLGEPIDLVSAEIEKQISCMKNGESAATLRRKGFSPLQELTDDPGGWARDIFRDKIQLFLPRNKPPSDTPSISQEEKNAFVQEKQKPLYYSNGFIAGMAIVAGSLLSHSCDAPPLSKFMTAALATAGLLTAAACTRRSKIQHVKVKNWDGPPQ